MTESSPASVPASAPAPTIDVHSHFFPKDWPDLAEKFGTPDWPRLKHTGPNTAMVMVGDTEFRPVTSACWDPDVRLEAMDRDGVDIQVMSPTPVCFAYDRPPAQAAEAAEIFNDAALEIAAKSAGRIRTLCQVPLQDPDAACAELDRSMAAGHAGVEIGNHVGETDLDDAGIITFLQHCAEIGAPVFVHPWDMLGGARVSRWMMAWTVGMPAETHLSITTMILSGAFDHLPATLRICFAHGGGAFPLLVGRLDNAWHGRPDLVATASEHPPSHYLGRFLTDSAVFDPRALHLLTEVIGEDNVLLGSDYPYPLGEGEVGSLIRTAPGFSDEQRAKMLGGNAARFLGLEAV